jgi:hypothetical protein
MNAPYICIVVEENGEPAPECEPPTMTSPGCDHWRETTLQRLEEWIDERERLIAAIEMRIQDETLAAVQEAGGSTITESVKCDNPRNERGRKPHRTIGPEIAPEAIEKIVFGIGYSGWRRPPAGSG